MYEIYRICSQCEEVGNIKLFSVHVCFSVNKGEFRMYRGSRAEKDFVSFVDDKKWQQVEPVAWYFNPTSMQ